MTPSQKRTMIGLSLAASLSAAVVVGILAAAPASKAPTGALPSELELFAERERIRDREWPALNRSAALLLARVPAREGDADRLLILKSLAATCDVLITAASFDPPHATGDGSGPYASVRLTVTGGADQVRAFLAAVEQGERLCLLDAFSLTRASERTAVKADVRLHFVLRDPNVALAPFQAPLKEG